MSHPCTCDKDACRCVQLLVLVFDAQLTVKAYKPTAPLMGGQQSSEHHMHRLLIQPTNRHLGSWHFCRVLFLKSYWPVYDAVEIALNPAALIKKKTSSQNIKLRNGPRSKIYGRLIANEIMKFRTFVTACLSVFMFVRVTADRSLLLGIRGVAYETCNGSDGTCREQEESSFPVVARKLFRAFNALLLASHSSCHCLRHCLVLNTY